MRHSDSSSAPPPFAPESWWSRLSPVTRHTGCLGLLLLVAIAFYSPVLFEGKSLGGADFVNWRAGAEVVLEYNETTNDPTLWNPNVFSGMPTYLTTYGIAVPQLDTAINALRSVSWPIGHTFLMMAGVYLLLVYLTQNALSGLLAAFGFGFTTYVPIILSVGHQTKFVALAYAPFVLLAFVYALRRPSLLAGLLFAGALSLELRAKHPQITYCLLMAVFVWWVVEAIGAVRDGKSLAFAKSTGALVLGTFLALCMVAQPYMATYQYKQFSTRGTEIAAGSTEGNTALAWNYAMQWSQGVKETVTLLVADAFGGGGQPYWGDKPSTSGPHYVGGILVALAALALWKGRRRTVWGLGLAAGATMVFAWGRHAAWINRPMFEYFPFFDAFRAPETWLSITALMLAILGGIGLDYALRFEPSTERKPDDAGTSRVGPIVAAFGGVAVFVSLLWIGPSVLFDFQKPREEQRIVEQLQQQTSGSSQQQLLQTAKRQVSQKVAQRRSDFRADAQRTLFFLVIAGGTLLLCRQRWISPLRAGLLVAGLLLIDLWGIDKRYLDHEQYSETTEASTPIKTYDYDRFLTQKRNAAGGSGHFRVLSLVEGSPSATARPSYHHEQIGGYHGAKLQRYQNYLDHVLQAEQGVPNENALDLMNTRYVVAANQLPGTEVVHRGEQTGALVLRNPDAVPRGFFVGQTEVVSSPQKTWKRLRSPSFAPHRTALVPEPLDGPVTPLDSTATAQATLKEHTPPSVTWEIQTDAPRLFVASEVYYPAGWTAYLNGTEVPIHRVNYLLRGVHVPAGKHTLVMRFEPQVHSASVWISGTSTALVYGGLLWLVGVPYLRRRFHTTSPNGT